MLEKDFVPHQESLELKQLGLDEPCFAMFMRDKFLERNYCKNSEFEDKELFTAAPTFSQAFRFFREKYGDYLLYSFGVIPHFTIIQNLIIEDSSVTYEQAELECLRKLIKIVKNK